MKMLRVLKLSAAVLGLSSLAGMAVADCRFNEGAGFFGSMPLLGGNITVGRDVPLGTEVYRQTFQVPTYSVINCDRGLYEIERVRTLPVTPMPLSTWAGSPYGGQVYQTNVSGIGVAVWHANTAMPFTRSYSNCGGGTASCNWVNIQTTMAFDISLIKIGEVSPGTIRGVLLPTMAQSWVSSNTLEVQRVSLTGSINIVSRTCSTPDVTVPMDTHQLSEFSGVNSATPWKDFSIALNNCPAFHGIYSGTGPRWLSDGTSNNLDSRTSNLLRLRLDPVRTAINPGQGILSLDPSAPGDAPAASGIGVQVADSHGGALPLATLRTSGITPRATEGASYSIPLKARYIQTAGSVTAGPANASAVFTINYQ
ncbi:Fimbrial adhesin [Pseudomonas chlororaphis subsp. aureofaciens]|uniref:fimbrial protein n=1 Tax=Pseudomonas chlororaphis TaxID=587753 RepID=UPI000F6F3075|nr:fimbrial protein [Pseudomonas chlororaphis]AZD87474.1 Fimbrial adhesin [Pseudomonas chlororaphis subsp. aureofaciens]